MNVIELEILKYLSINSGNSQRNISMNTGYSLGRVNKAIKYLEQEEYIDGDMNVLEKGIHLIKRNRPKNAIILAAGYGMRMVPIGKDMPKGLLEVDGETLIERLIKQLNEVGIFDITIVVGFMKEAFEYLIDLYGVKLVINRDYAIKNNLHSLNLVSNDIDNTYILPSDIYFISNPFSKVETYSWYMISNEDNENSNVYINRNLELVKTTDEKHNNFMVGVSYVTLRESNKLKSRLKELEIDSKSKNSFWEEALFEKDRMYVNAKMIKASQFVEINTYEQLRGLDDKSDSLKSDVIAIISKSLECRKSEITNIKVLKKGMTNRSFMFEVKDQKYIMRIPGEGTDKLINRSQEYDVYQSIRGKGICDNPVYINADNGYKLTKYLSNARPADAYDESDVLKCMTKLRKFHDMSLKVNHEFDLFAEIDFYEKLRGEKSLYRDYQTTKENVFSLKDYVKNNITKQVLTHIDAVPDNFLFYETDEGEEGLQLTDWEYAGMQDPHVDIAMFCIYSMYDRAHVDRLIDIYFEGVCSLATRIKIYCYISIAGLLWSNWCEYKYTLGVEFGEYALRQYRYAKEYYKIAVDEMRNIDGK